MIENKKNLHIYTPFVSKKTKYEPHQGKAEKERRKKQIEKGFLKGDYIRR